MNTSNWIKIRNDANGCSCSCSLGCLVVTAIVVVTIVAKLLGYI